MAIRIFYFGLIFSFSSKIGELFNSALTGTFDKFYDLKTVIDYDYEEKLPKKADLQISPSGLILLNHTMDVLQCSVFTLVIFKYKVWN